MIRHLKMELKRRPVEDQSNGVPNTGYLAGQSQDNQAEQEASLDLVSTSANGPAVKRQRGRRSSKPQMEMRRRARINQCLDTLKRHVLTDPTNLAHLGIDASSRENHDEESIARTVLETSGLIYRHKGRKNPNKLEKADILELAVDYVQRLHSQRDLLLADLRTRHSPLASLSSSTRTPDQGLYSRPLSVQVPGGHRAALDRAGLQLSPPASSSSSTPTLLAVYVGAEQRRPTQVRQPPSDYNHAYQPPRPQHLLSEGPEMQALDLSNSNSKQYSMEAVHHTACLSAGNRARQARLCPTKSWWPSNN